MIMFSCGAHNTWVQVNRSIVRCDIFSDVLPFLMFDTLPTFYQFTNYFSSQITFLYYVLSYSIDVVSTLSHHNWQHVCRRPITHWNKWMTLHLFKTFWVHIVGSNRQCSAQLCSWFIRIILIWLCWLCLVDMHFAFSGIIIYFLKTA